jgi:hypothetical protein
VRSSGTTLEQTDAAQDLSSGDRRKRATGGALQRPTGRPAHIIGAPLATLKNDSGHPLLGGRISHVRLRRMSHEELPEVAPFDSCLCCLRGDTTTGLLLEGSPEWVVVSFHKLTDMSLDEAKETFYAMAEEAGYDPGMVRLGSNRWGVRLCLQCAQKAGARVGELGGDSIPLYAEREEE